MCTIPLKRQSRNSSRYSGGISASRISLRLVSGCKCNSTIPNTFPVLLSFLAFLTEEGTKNAMEEIAIGRMLETIRGIV